MKVLLIGILALGSISAFADVCDVKVVYAADASHIKLLMEDKAIVEDDETEFRSPIKGSNPDKLNCEDLIRRIKSARRSTVGVEGEYTPLKIIHTINLES